MNPSQSDDGVPLLESENLTDEPGFEEVSSDIPHLPDLADDSGDAFEDDEDSSEIFEESVPMVLPEPIQEESSDMPEAEVATPSVAEPMVDATYRVRLPAAQSPVNLNAMRSSATPSIPGVGTAVNYAATVDHLRLLSEDATASGFRVQVRRRGPASFNGFRLPTGIIEEMDPMPFEDVQSRVAELHGGGTYNLQVITPTGQMSRQMLFRVDENVHEPKVPANALPVNMMQSSEFGRMVRPNVNLGAMALGTHTPEDQIMIDLRRQEQILQATKMKEDREHEIEKSRRRRKAEEEADRESEERKKMLPEITEANRRVESLKDEMHHMAESFKDSIRELASHKGDDSGLKMLVESMKLSSEQQQQASQRQLDLMAQANKQQTDLLIALISNVTKEKPADNGVIEAIKMNVESQKQTSQMLIDSAKNENAVMRELFMTVVTQRLSAPDDQVKLHQQAEDRGWTKAMELTRLLEEARAGADDGIEIDPDNGFWGNIGNVALQGIQRAIRGAAGGGLRGALQSALNPNAGYPHEIQAPAQYRSQPVQQAPAMPVQQLPAAVQTTPVLPSPSPEVQGSPLFEGLVYEDGNTASVVTPPSAQVQALPAPVPAQQQMTGSDEEEDLRMHVTEAMRMALEDFKVGRKVHDWSDHAIDKWHRQFKIELAQAPDDAARIQLIGQKCEPAVYEQVVNRIRGGGQDVFYFTQAIQAVVQDAAKEFAA